MIKKGDKLIIVCEALQDENNGTVYVKLPSESQSSMVMLTENVKKAPEKIDNYVVGDFQDGYNQALEDCGVIQYDSN